MHPTAWVVSIGATGQYAGQRAGQSGWGAALSLAGGGQRPMLINWEVFYQALVRLRVVATAKNN